MATKIAAISGGVDSVVLLDMLAQTAHTVVVAHVDHGIRDDSADDARFVRQLAARYGYVYQEKRLHLGAEASEEKAREERYAFLYILAKKYKADIITAHHGDDLAETVAINLHRGTGWRGLAVLAREGIERPLLAYSKQDLYGYAMKHHLEWVEDKTNRDKRYLRNRIRANLMVNMPDKVRQQLKVLRDRQVTLTKEVAAEEQALVRHNDSLRHFLTQVDHAAAVDILGTLITQETGLRPTRPQLERALIAVKTAKAGTMYQVGSGVSLRFESRVFSVEVV